MLGKVFNVFYYGTFRWKHTEDNKIQESDAQVKGQDQKYSCEGPLSPVGSTENMGRV